jgi:hypothetical protein
MTRLKKTAMKRAKRPVPKDRAEKIRALPKELTKYHRLLEPLVEGLVQDTLLTNYQMGEIMVNAETDLDARAKENPSLQECADRHVEHLAEASGIDRRTLSDCKRVARAYTREEYQKLMSKPRVTWPHVVHLLNARGKKLRRAMEEKVVSKGWSANQLKAEIRASQGNIREGTGRPPKVPGSLNHAFHMVTSGSKQIARRLTEVLFGDRYDISAVIKTCPPNKIGEQTPQQIDESIEALEKMVAAGRMGIRRLRQGKRCLRERANGQPNGVIDYDVT